MIEKIKAKVLQDMQVAESEGFIPTGLATLYLLVNIFDRLEPPAKEHDEEQETHTQGHETDDVLQPGQDQGQGNGTLHPVQEGLRRDDSSIDRGSDIAEGGEDTSVDKTPHWQDTNADIQEQLAGMQKRGVAYLTWEADNSGNICDNCVANHGKRVRVGERFPSGAYYTPEHDHCGCQCKEERDDGSIVSGGEKL